MQIWLEVENFAKIESAKICLGKYILFVGQNNSGKTFLMQLIQGILEKLIYLMDERALSTLLDENEDAYTSYLISNDNISQFVDYLNEHLLAEKEMIIKEIFQREIPIGKLSIHFCLEEDFAYKIFILDLTKNYKDHLEKILGPSPSALIFEHPIPDDIHKICIADHVNLKNGTVGSSLLFISRLQIENSQNLLRLMMENIMECSSLFLPASRTGLLLLYRDFFLNKADHVFSYSVNNNQVLKHNQNYGGLTKPTYEFLRFLQTFSEKESNKEKFIDELLFFENNLIEGHISMDEQKTFLYRAKNDENEVPMYLASSLINEVAPLVMAITGNSNYDWLIIDEIESSVHPEKQGELVRFLNRLNRKGKKLIISTHSDTFVSKMNNLYILSYYYQRFCKDNDTDIFHKLHLSPEDFINPSDLLVYEFVLQDNGKSIVKEVRGNEKTGFQFDLFASSSMKLYDETLKIGELLE